MKEIESISDMTRDDIAEELDVGFRFWTHDEMVKVVRVMDKALEELEARTQWQDISTAPKDGRVLLLGRFNSHKMWRTLRGQWFTQQDIDEEWEEHHECFEGWYETSVEADDLPNVWQTSPTHWMPLPKPPKED